jgi:hypothetical protein
LASWTICLHSSLLSLSFSSGKVRTKLGKESFFLFSALTPFFLSSGCPFSVWTVDWVTPLHLRSHSLEYKEASCVSTHKIHQVFMETACNDNTLQSRTEHLYRTFSLWLANLLRKRAARLIRWNIRRAYSNVFF